MNADFTHSGKRIHKKKIRKKKNKEYDMYKKDCQDRNNARNRDAFSITKANKMLKDEQSANGAIEQARSSNLNETEDLLIARLDGLEKEQNKD